MARISNEKKAEALAAANEENANLETVAESFGISASTLIKWREAETGEPQGVAPPSVSVSRSKGKGGGKNASRPITEKTAGNILAGIFGIYAQSTNDPVFFLSQVEKAALAEPFAETMSILPNPVSDAVNTYSAPAVFITTLYNVISAKQRASNMRKVTGLTVVPRVQPIQQPATPNEVPATEPEAETTQDDSASIKEAINAAKGGLAGLDESGEGTDYFQRAGM